MTGSTQPTREVDKVNKFNYFGEICAIDDIKKIDKIEDDPDDKTFPAHCIDNSHEVDCTDTLYVETDFSSFEMNGDYPRAYNADEVTYYFHTGPNTGANILSGEMREIARRLTGLYALIGRPGGSVTCTDDVSGAPLDEGLVTQARALEIHLFEAMGAYTRVPRAGAHRSGHGKIIRGRWLDINKGDTERPDYRSRFVGNE